MINQRMGRRVHVVAGVLLCAAVCDFSPGAISDVQQLVLRARSHEAAGRLDAAGAAWSAAIEKSGDAPRINQAARKGLIGLMLKREQPDLVQIESHLAAFRAADGSWSGGGASLACRLLLAKVRVTKSELKAKAWRDGYEALLRGQSVGGLSQQVLEEFDALRAGFDGRDDETAVGDLLLCVDDRRTRAQLKVRLRAAVYARSADVRRILIRAEVDRLRGRLAAARAKYESVINDEDATGELIRVARRRLVQVLLAQAPFDTAAAGEHIDALVAAHKGGDWPDELWNARCRLLFREVAAADDRVRIWGTGLEELAAAAGRPVLGARTLRELDSLCEAVDRGGLAWGDMVTDLLLLGPDLLSMFHLQVRRADVIGSEGDAEDAMAAGRLLVMLSLALPDGPSGAMQKLLADARSNGLTDEAVGRLRQTLLVGADGQGHIDAIASEMVDQPLKSAAEALLKRIDEQEVSRRRMFARLFAGRWRAALADAGRRGSLARAADGQFDRAVDDAIVVAAVSGGGIGPGIDAARWLATESKSDDVDVEGAAVNEALQSFIAGFEREIAKNTMSAAASDVFDRVGDLPPYWRRQLAGAVCTRWRDLMIRWGLDALGSEKPQWAGGYWAGTIALGDAADSKGDTVQTIFDQARRDAPPKQLIEAFEAASRGRLAPAGRIRLRQKIAAVHYERGRYKQCLAKLDRARAYAAERGLPAASFEQVMAVGFMRALCQIRLRRPADALPLLEDMEAWHGTVEEHARVNYLIGWIYLQRGEKERAVRTLRQVQVRFAATRYAEQAGQLIDRLEHRS